MGQEGIIYLFGRSQCIWNVLGLVMKAFGKCMGRLLLHLVFVIRYGILQNQCSV